MTGYETVTVVLAVFTIVLTVVTIVLTIWLFKLSNKIDNSNFWYRTIFIQDNGLIKKIFVLKSDIEEILRANIGIPMSDLNIVDIMPKLKQKFRIFDENFYIVEVMSKSVSKKLAEISSEFRDEIINYVDNTINIEKYTYTQITTEYLKKMLTVIYKYSNEQIKNN